MNGEEDIRTVSLAVARGLVPIERAREAVLGRTAPDPVSATLKLDPGLAREARDIATLPAAQQGACLRVFDELFRQPPPGEVRSQDEALARALVEQGIVFPWQTDECLAIQRRLDEVGVRPLPRLGALLASRGHLRRGGPSEADLAISESRMRAMPDEARGVSENAASRCGKYVRTMSLGRGGMGEVWKAWDTELRRWAALKFLQDRDGPARQYFLREAHLAAGLEHPNIAKVYEVGDRSGDPFIAMQFIDGETLETARPRLKTDEKLRAVRDVAEAVRLAHAAGVIHRDLKPANVMLDRAGRVYVMDFGIAKKLSADEGGTSRSECIVGTPNYMSPEQTRGEADRQSDVYAVGGILYFLMTGRPPFTGETAGEVLAQVVTQELVWPRRLNPATPEDVEAVILKCLEKDRKKRYAGVERLVEDLDAVLAHEPLRHARRITWGYVMRKRIRKRPQVYGLAAALVLAVAAGTAFGTVQLLRARAAALRAQREAEERARTEQEKARVEREERAKTEAAKDRANERLAYAYRLRARLAAESGDGPATALFHAEAYAAHATDLTRASAAAALGRLCRLRDIWAHEDPVRALLFAADGSRVATMSGKGIVRVWDFRTGLPTEWAIQTGGRIESVAFSPDGTRLATAGEDGAVRCWDAGTGGSVGETMRHACAVVAAVFSPDGTRLATASEDRTARLWDVATGRPVGAPMRHDGEVRAAVFSPDGGRVATGSADRTARLWDAGSGEPVGSTMSHGGSVSFVAFAHGGRRLVAASVDGMIRTWDVATGRQVGTAMRHERLVVCVAYSRDGARLAAAGVDGKVRLWDAATGEPAGTIEGHRGVVWSAAFSPDGRRMATGGADRTARLWDAATCEPIGSDLRHEDEVSCVAFSPDGRGVVTGSRDGTARIWDAAPGERAGKEIRHEGAVKRVAFSPDGTRLATGGADGTARLLDAATGAPVGKAMSHGNVVWALAFDPAGKRLASGSADGTARLWDAATGEPVGKIMRHGGTVWSLSFSLDGKRLATGSEDRTVRFWEAATGEPVGPVLRQEHAVTVVAFSPDGRRVAARCAESAARLWDAATGEPVGPALRHEKAVSVVCFSPDATRLATAGWDGTARSWDAATGEPAGAAIRHGEAILALAFSPDGRLIATGSREKSARLWDAATGKPLGKPMAHGDTLWSVAFSPDGKWLATGSEDRTARLWDVATGEAVGTPMRHGNWVTAAFSPDGKWLATAGGDKAARLWDVSFLSDPAPPALLLLRARVRTGLRMDRADEIEFIPPQEWRGLRERLRLADGAER
ncbi:MAG: protein kinase [Planctomycetes bacterium]|nr:protein kinase [Planctomycetota bacterium]